MQKQINFQVDENGEKESKFNSKYLISLSLGFLAVVTFLLFVTISTDLRCFRSATRVECSLSRSTTVFKMSEIKIQNPLAVDIIEHRRKGTSLYIAELRSLDISYTFPLVSSYSPKTVESVAKEVNDFLLSSDKSSFYKKFSGILR